MTSERKSGFEKSYFKNYCLGTLPYLYNVKIRPALKKVSVGSKVLDIGCATGFILSKLDGDGFDTYGVDISEFALSCAEKITSAQLQLADANKPLPFKENSYKVVLALDIIEHLDSPANFCREVRRILKPGGLFLLHTPNISSIFEKLMGENWFGYKDKSHLYLFNKKNLTYLLCRAGFRVLTGETISYPAPAFLRSLLAGTEIGGSLWMIAQKA